MKILPSTKHLSIALLITLTQAASAKTFCVNTFWATALSNFPFAKIPVAFITHSLMQHPFGGPENEFRNLFSKLWGFIPDNLPFGGPTGLVKSVSHFIVMAESINIGILQQSVGFLAALKAMHSGAIPGAPGGATAGAGPAGGALWT